MAITKASIIDADTHVDETEATWEYIDSELAQYKPEYVKSQNFDPTRAPGSGHYWLIEGQRQRRRVRSDELTQTTQNSRELANVEERLRHMDKMGVGVHVIYPTLFATGFTENPAAELALRQSYNRWLADRTGQTKESRERLRWVMLPTMLNIGQAIEDMRWAKENGACGILKMGDKEAGYWPSEEYFFPLYEEAERLDLTICFHLGGGVADHTSAARYAHVNFMQTRAPVINAFQSLVHFSVPAKFPKLRFAFVEAGAYWLPYVVYTLKRTQERRAVSEGGGIGGPDYSMGENLLKENRLFVTCQVDEDIPYILKFAGEDNIMVGSDYSHSDPSQEGNFAELMRDWARRGNVSETAIEKILSGNAKACYGL